MEAPKPFDYEPKQKRIHFIEEFFINSNNKDYRIQLGIVDHLDKNEMIIRIAPKNDNGYYFFENIYNFKDFQSLSKIFLIYENLNEIISFIKTLKLEILEFENCLKVKFKVFLPNGKEQEIDLDLKKIIEESKKNDYLIQQNKNLENEIILLKEKYDKEILLVKNENKKLWDEINKLKDIFYKENSQPIIKSIDSKIINSINEIDYILKYIKDNDNSFQFNSLKLLFRGSRDGERTKKCHQLCDNKKNVLIIIKSDSGNIFGGYCKIGFRTCPDLEYKIDNNSFLFSNNLRKIYPAINNSPCICHINDSYGLCFYASLCIYDWFMSNSNSEVCGGACEKYFNELTKNYEMNGGNRYFKCVELEVFQLIS